MTWTAADIGDLTGRTAVVTGANGGLGLETAKALAGAGAHVVMAARNQAKAADAHAAILARHPAASLEIVELDLGDLALVQAAAEKIKAGHEAVDILVNNAGLMAMPQGVTADGFEMQLGVNHLGHFALTAHLMPALLRAEAARVVTVTSTARHLSWSLNPADPHLRNGFQPWKAYGQAKKANYHFALGLDQRFRDAGVPALSLAAHPGLSNTDLQATTVAEGAGGRVAEFFHMLSGRVGMTAEQGARPQLRAATDPAAKGGTLYGPRFVATGPAVVLPVIRHPKLQEEIDTLWRISEAETGLTILESGEAQSGMPD